MTLDSDEKIDEGKILEKFDFEGLPASVIVVEPEDLDEDSKRLLAVNLANTNFKLLDVPQAKARSKVRGLVLGVRAKLDKHVQGMDSGLVRALGSKLAGKLEKIGTAVYPDYTPGEHERGYKMRFEKLAQAKNLVGVKIDGKMVAVQGFTKVGDTPSGREVFEFTKASTLNDPKYRNKGLNRKLLKAIYEKVQAEHSEAVWVSASVNPAVIARAEKNGWHVVDIDDQHEAIITMNSRNPDYVKVLKEQGYKAFYFDPKVDKLPDGEE